MEEHNPDKSTVPTDTIDLAAAAIHVFATQTIRYLHMYGSKMRYLAWKSLTSMYLEPYELKFEGDVVPNHAYYKGRTEDDAVESRVVAIPVDDYAQNMRESSILSISEDPRTWFLRKVQEQNTVREVVKGPTSRIIAYVANGKNERSRHIEGYRCTAFWRIRAKTTGIREQTFISSDLISDKLIGLVAAQYSG
jgi:hypothetical protein